MILLGNIINIAGKIGTRLSLMTVKFRLLSAEKALLSLVSLKECIAIVIDEYYNCY